MYQVTGRLRGILLYGLLEPLFTAVSCVEVATSSAQQAKLRVCCFCPQPRRCLWLVGSSLVVHISASRLLPEVFRRHVYLHTWYYTWYYLILYQYFYLATYLYKPCYKYGSLREGTDLRLTSMIHPESVPVSSYHSCSRYS